MSFKTCSVPICENTSENEPNKYFFSVPKFRSRKFRKLWADAARSADSFSEIGGYVCEDHFNLSKDCSNWSYFSLLGDNLVLKPDAIPHKYIDKHPPERLPCQVSIPKRTTNNDHNDLYIAIISDKTTQKLPFLISKPEIRHNKLAINSETPPPPLTPAPSLRTQLRTYPKASEVRDKNHQKEETTSETIEKPSFIIFIDDSSPSKLITRVPKITIIKLNDQSVICEKRTLDENEIELEENNIIDLTEEDDTELSIKVPSHLYLGLPKKESDLVKVLMFWTKIQQVDILLILKKLQLNESFEKLAADFETDKITLMNTFLLKLNQLASFMKRFIYWPTSSKIRKSLPAALSKKCAKVESVIDCVEVGLLKPDFGGLPRKGLTCQHNADCKAIKYLISCTPNGFINYISPGFASCLSDEQIVTNSGFLSALPNGAKVIVDGKGFSERLVDGEKSRFLQLSRAEKVPLTIYHQRTIRRLRRFELLQARLEFNLVHFLNEIMIVACGIVNIQEHVIK